jgi:predicted transcriptional regulator of viral defense system
MPRSYKSVNVTEEQQSFIKLMDDYEVQIFINTEIEKLFNQKFDNLGIILENLTNKGFLSRIEKGKYCRANFRNESVIGCYLVPDGALSYWTALNRHGLTEQFSNKIFIQTTKNKKEKEVFGTTYKFIRIGAEKQLGIIKEGYGNNTYRITDICKTIVDCFDLPKYSGGFAELLRAFAQANLTSGKLIEYSTAVHNSAAIKRMGFIAELLDKKGLRNFIKFAKSRQTTTYDLFDPNGSREGIPLSEWRLRLNISKEDIISICQSQLL